MVLPAIWLALKSALLPLRVAKGNGFGTAIIGRRGKSGKFDHRKRL